MVGDCARSILFPMILFRLQLLSLILFLTPFVCEAQEFTGRQYIIDMIDEVSYEVPGFGTIKFEYSKRSDDSQNWRGGSQFDEAQKVPFHVRVKRENEKRWERDDYFAWFEMPSYLERETGRENYESPNERYWATFTISRDAIYQIKDFPSIYVIFADGDMYYQDWNWTTYSFEEAKARYLKMKTMDKDSVDISYKKCNRINE